MPKLGRFIAIGLLLVSRTVFCQEIGDDKKRAAPSLSETAGMPALFRTPETGLGLGAVIIYTKDTSVRKPSPIISGLMYTEKKQLLWATGTKQNFDNGNFAFFGYFELTKFPQKYYGVGNNTRLADEEVYQENRVALEFGGETKVYRSLSLGLKLLGQRDTHDQFESQGMFSRNEVSGQQGGHQRGFQGFLFWDTADDNFYPSKGSKITLAYINYLDELGSEYPYDGIKLDARIYRQLTSQTILATQVYVQGLNQNPPFYQLGQLGGNDLLRGYFKGRYRDRKLTVLHSELRQSISKYWRVVAFGGFGNVHRDWDQYTLDNLKPAYGAGLRYQITTKQKLNLRLDVGIGEPKEGPQVYLYVMEAF
ncbi:MAG: hypothetical protein ACOH5I_22710 [Oligoflexus sp.]